MRRSIISFGLCTGLSLVVPAIAMAADNATNPGPERGMTPPSDPKAVAGQPGEGSERGMVTKPPAPGEADKDKSKVRAMPK